VAVPGCAGAELPGRAVQLAVRLAYKASTGRAASINSVALSYNTAGMHWCFAETSASESGQHLGEAGLVAFSACHHASASDGLHSESAC
jgi:hypothetical protein